MNFLIRKARLCLLVCRTRKAHQRNLLRRVRLTLQRMEYLQRLYHGETEQEEGDE